MFKSGRVTLRELLRLALDIYRHCFKYIALIGLGIYVPVNIVYVVLAARFDIGEISAILAGTADMSGMYRYVTVGMIIEVAVMPLETAALTYLTRQRLDKAEVSTEGVLDASFGNWRRLFITALCYAMLVIPGSILIIPALMFGVSFLFYANIIAVSETSGIMALRQSANLVRGRWWRTLSVLVFINIGLLCVQSLISVILGPAFDYVSGISLAAQALSVIGSVIADTLGMFFKIILALYFFDLYYASTTSEVPV